MKANIKYFGMIAEKIGKSEESVDLDEKNQSDLRNYFVEEYPFLDEIDYQIAVNQTLTEVIDPKTEFVEIALLPASHLKMNAEVHNVYDNEQNYEYFNHNATDNVEDSGLAFMVGKAIMGTMKAHRYMNKDDILLHLLHATNTTIPPLQSARSPSICADFELTCDSRTSPPSGLLTSPRPDVRLQLLPQTSKRPRTPSSKL